MEYLTKRSFVLGFVLVALAFSVAAVYVPWWRISTTRENGITNNVSIRAEYGLFQTVSASKTVMSGNATESITVSFANFTRNEADKNALSTLFNITFNLTLAGLTFTVLTTAILFLSCFRMSFFKYAKITGIIATILLFVAPIYFAAEMPTIVSNLESVIPTEIHVLPGEQIHGFWGEIRMDSGLQEWLWSPALGWFLTFTASLLDAAGAILLHIFYGKK